MTLAAIKKNNSINMETIPLPPSSKIVLRVLENGGLMTHKDIVAKTHLAPRTVRYALKKLKERQLLVELFNIRDARQIIYLIRATWSPKPAITFI